MRCGSRAGKRVYHGFVLGLLVDLRSRYELKSNSESGFGRYDVILVPRNLKEGNAVILEFKVRNVRKEKSLEETARSALDQIRERRDSEELKNRGISEERINRYGFAFEGKKVLILDEND